jgi:hypothetical protein
MKILAPFVLAPAILLGGCFGIGGGPAPVETSSAVLAWIKAVQDGARNACNYEPGLQFLLGLAGSFGGGAVTGTIQAVVGQVCAVVDALPMSVRRTGKPKAGAFVVRIGGVPFDPARDGRFVR